MIEDAPQLQTQPIIRPDSKLVDQLRGTPTGFLVDAMGGSGALDFRIKPAVLEQYAFCGVALTCHAGPADNLALVHALQYVEPGTEPATTRRLPARSAPTATSAPYNARSTCGPPPTVVAAPWFTTSSTRASG